MNCNVIGVVLLYAMLGVRRGDGGPTLPVMIRAPDPEDPKED